jgi:SAM-dependent methyltransferase
MTETVDWSTVAAGWNEHRAHVEQMKLDVTKRLLDDLQLRPGNRVLELGAGTGELARQLAGIVGPSGSVVATDAAAGMVELIRDAIADLPHAESAQVDAAAIEAPDASFDAVVFRMGLMFLPEPLIGLREMHRVLKRGGRIGVLTWAGIEHNPWLTTVGMTGMLAGALNGTLPTSPGGPLSLGDPTALQQLATEANFADATVTDLPVVFEVPDTDAHLSHVTSLAPPIKAGYDAATEEQRVAWRQGLEQATQQFVTPGGLRIPGRALLLVATRG